MWLKWERRQLLCSCEVGYLNKTTVEPDLIVSEMLAFPSNSSRNKNGSDPKNGKTTPIHDIMGITYIVQFSDSNDSNDVLPLFLLWLNHFYKIQFSSSSWMEEIGRASCRERV